MTRRLPDEFRERDTPYRKGRIAAGEYWAGFVAWRDGDHTAPRPVKPTNPYPLGTGKGRRAGAFQWDQGFNAALQYREREDRITRSKERKKP